MFRCCFARSATARKSISWSRTSLRFSAEFANGDGAREVDFADYVDVADQQWLYENCVSSAEYEEPLDVMRTQIDMALDLLTIARQMGHVLWQEQLKKRLKVLSERRDKLKQRGKNTTIG